jgi:hypothetical protein
VLQWQPRRQAWFSSRCDRTQLGSLTALFVKGPDGGSGQGCLLERPAFVSCAWAMRRPIGSILTPIHPIVVYLSGALTASIMDPAVQ